MRYRINVISHKRPQNVQRSYYNEIINDITYYVGKDEKQIYLEHGAKHVVESGGLIESRNAALQDTWNTGYDCCIMVEDDLKSLSLAFSKKKKMPIDLVSAIELLVFALKEYPEYYLAGVAPTPNLFYFNPEKIISTRNFIVGSLIAIKKTDLFFDSSLTLKEDYDYTLQHIKKYGGVVRCNNIIAHFEHYANKGGVVGYRNSEREQENINKLKTKWGSNVKDNPRRPNEILLKVR